MVQHAGNEGVQALAGNDVLLVFALEVIGHALGHVRRQPPPAVARTFGGVGHGALDPLAFEAHGAAVGQADERKIVGEGDH